MTELTVAEIAALCGAPLEGAALAAHGARTVTGPAALADAGPSEVSFLGNPRYASALETTQACAVLVPEGTASERADVALLPCTNPNRAFTRLVEAFRPVEPCPAAGVADGAQVDPSAHLGEGVAIGVGAIVGARARLAEGVILHPGAIVGPGVSIGAETRIHSGAVLAWGVQVGSRCVVHSGAVLGSDGFGFDPTPEGWVKIPQCGTVVVEDDVEIGANCAIDRGRFGATRIGRGAKIDNLVHLAHNVVVGPNALLIAQVGVAGSAKIGEHAILAGQVGVGGHVTVGAGARIAGQSGVTKDVAGGVDYFGTPCRPKTESFRILRELGRLPALAERIKQLEASLERLESGAQGRKGS